MSITVSIVGVSSVALLYVPEPARLPNGITVNHESHPGGDTSPLRIDKRGDRYGTGEIISHLSDPDRGIVVIARCDHLDIGTAS